MALLVAGMASIHTVDSISRKSDSQMKTCAHCQTPKPETDFYDWQCADPHNQAQWSRWCKQCYRKLRNNDYRRFGDKIRTQNNARRAANLEHHKEIERRAGKKYREKFTHHER